MFLKFIIKENYFYILFSNIKKGGLNEQASLFELKCEL